MCIRDSCDPKELGVTELVYYPVLAQILEEYSADPEELAEAIRKNIHELIPKHITKEDIIASINYNIHLEYLSLIHISSSAFLIWQRK